MRSLFQWLVLSALALAVPLETLASDFSEEKPWRDETCGFWIPSETSTPAGYTVETVTGERLGPMKTAFWNDRWNPNWSKEEPAYVHEVDLKLLAANSVADPTEVVMLCEILFEISLLVERGEGKEKDPFAREERDSRCVGETAQNPILYDEVLKRVKDEYPASRVVDLYVVKKWISVNWW